MSSEFDVVVAGGGYVGASLAVALAEGDPRLSIAVVDPTPPTSGPDARASAIAAAARRMLDRLGVWQAIAPHAQPITDMIVTDSRLDDAVRPVFLTFDGTLSTGEPFAHMVPNAVMVGALLDRALKLQALAVFGERLAGHAARFGIAVPRLALSSARTRWGSCSLKSGIRLNWRLIHGEPHLIDYVIVHELAHLTEMNHGARFWAIVERYFPEHRNARDALKKLSGSLPVLA